MGFINSVEFDTIWKMAKPVKVLLTDSKNEVEVDCTTKEATQLAIENALSTNFKNYAIKGYKVEVGRVNIFKSMREHNRSNIGVFPNVLKIILEKNKSTKAK